MAKTRAQRIKARKRREKRQQRQANQQNEILNTAVTNTNLRYAPEERGINELLGQAKQDLHQDLRVNAGVTDEAVSAARESRRPIRKIYNVAKRQVANAQSDVDLVLKQAGVTPGSIFEVAGAREFGNDRSQLSTEAAGAKRDAVRQEASAKLGKIFADATARQKYAQTKHQLHGRKQDIQDEKGQFLASTLAQLQAAAHKGDVTAHDRFVAGKAEDLARLKDSLADDGSGGTKKKKGWNPKTTAPPKGVKAATPTMVREMRDAVAKAKSVVDAIRDPKTIAKLAKGDPANGVDPIKISRNDRNQIGALALRRSGVERTALGLALDLAFNGYVGTKNTDYLRKTLGMSVDDLGLPRYSISRPKIKVRPT